MSFHHEEGRDAPEQPLALARALPAPEAKKERHEIWQLVYAIQKDIASASVKLAELRQAVSALDLPDPTTAHCPRCGIRTKGPRSLAEHMYVSHEASLPSHWELDA